MKRLLYVFPFFLLAYLSPHWAKLMAPGLSLSIAPPDGWVEGDKGTLFVLGGYNPVFQVDEGRLKSDLIFLSGEGPCINSDARDPYVSVYAGVLTDCGTAEMVDGRVVTSPIPRFSWVAISK